MQGTDLSPGTIRQEKGNLLHTAEDFRDEVSTLMALLSNLNEADFNIVTQFKGWTIDDVIGHLHMFDVALLMSVKGRAEFEGFFTPVARMLGQGKSMRDAQYPWLDGLRGKALSERWHRTAHELADIFTKLDPKRRLAWAGPDMSARSAITARQMETWAHGHEVFDVLGEARTETDRIANICHLGVNTFGWSFRVNGLDIPPSPPNVHLSLPSGNSTSWHLASKDESISGSAIEFAQVVTQTRNYYDTQLRVVGTTAQKWMEIAQCFAGPPEKPPMTGARFRIK